MSGPAEPSADDPALDPGVLAPLPLLEVQGWTAVARLGGLAILPWRPQARQAEAAGLTTLPRISAGLPSHAQALVRVTKGRTAVEADLAAAWSALTPGGRLVVAGPKDLGIASVVKRLESLLGPGETLAQRAHQKVVAWTRGVQSLPCPTTPRVALGDGSDVTLGTAPGVFSHDALDEGTATLLAVLADLPAPSRVADLGCGAGHLGLAALRRWPQATAWLGDADHRAVTVAQGNAQDLGLAGRATVAWWDAQEALPTGGFDLILTNPPAHAGAATSTDAAHAMFRVARGALAPGGRLVVVANRQLPYERPLAQLGCLTTMPSGPRFKVCVCHG